MFFIKKKVEEIYIKILLKLSELYIKRRRVYSLFKKIRILEQNYTQSSNFEKAFKILLEKKINYFDVGARGGPEKKLLKYKNFFSIILSEPEIEEAKRLKKQGYTVIDKIISNKLGKENFFLTKDMGQASILRINKASQNYFFKDKPGTEKIKLKKKLIIDATTLDEVEKRYKKKIHYLKLDTQGSEFLILHSMKKVKPIFIKTEVSCIEIYKKQFLLYDIGKLLYKRGYMIYRDNLYNRPAPFSKKFAKSKIIPSIGLPIHGDVYFMPDWTRDIGRQIIKKNELKWATIMLYEGQQQLLMHINSVVKLKNREKINKALYAL